MEEESSPSPASNSTAHRHTECHLMNTYGIIVQVVLAVLAFSTLLLKRWREPVKERRPLKIWFADTTKQAVGAGVIHLANVVFSSGYSKHDPCTWYLINFLLDSTAGLLTIYIVLLMAEKIAVWKNWISLRSGEYGDPFQWRYWFNQCMVYLLAMVIEKMIVMGIVQAHFWIKVSEVILPISNQRVRVALVMLVVPFFFNVLMFWVVDNFLKRKRRQEWPTNRSKAKATSKNHTHYVELTQLTDDSDDSLPAASTTSDGDCKSNTPTRTV